MNLRILELQGSSPRGFGEQHGEAFRSEIRALYAVRLKLMLQKTDLGSEENVLALAAHHLPLLERFDRALYDELCGIADGSGLTPPHLIVLNHYTDLRDLCLNTLRDLRERPTLLPGDPGGCSAWFVDDGHTRLLGQTWDMHGSATPFALMLLIPGPDEGQRTACFTVTGCLGMTGMTSWGTALCINNLNSLDATLGIVWPATVRRALRASDARAQLAILQHAPIGSGRHYLVADAHNAFGMETSGTKKKLIFEHGPAQGASYFHTNHCVDPEMIPTAKILAGSTTVARYATLQARSDSGRIPKDAREMFDAFADVSLPHNPLVADDVATCGALVMDLKLGTVLACQGLPGPDAVVSEFKL